MTNNGTTCGYRLRYVTSGLYRLHKLQTLSPSKLYELIDGISESQALDSDEGGDSDAEDQPVHSKFATVCPIRSSAGSSSTSRIPFEDSDDEGDDLEKDLVYNVNKETVSPSREIHCNLDNNNSSDSSEDSEVDNNSTALTTWKWDKLASSSHWQEITSIRATVYLSITFSVPLIY